MVGFGPRFFVLRKDPRLSSPVQNLVKGWRLGFGIKLLILWGKYSS
jgi:hypothetical protein